jgi:hypothetical protein
LRTLLSGPMTPPAVFDVWYDGNDTNGSGNSGISNGGNVASIRNKGTGGSAYNATANAPAGVLQRNYINGNTAIVGSTGYYKTAHSPFTVNCARTIFAVAKVPAANSAIVAFNDTFGQQLYTGNGSPVFETGGSPSPTNSVIPVAPATGLIVVLEYRQDGVTTHRPTLMINGVAQVVTQANGTGVGTETFTDDLYFQYLFAEGISDFLACVGLLDATHTDLTRKWINSKYGIPTS